MIIKTENGVSVALFVGKMTAQRLGNGPLGQDTAQLLALRELEEAGLPPLSPMEVEAYEGEGGWMVFAYIQSQPRERESYFAFASADDLLDALRIPPREVRRRVFRVGGRHFLRVAGEGGLFEMACAHLSEYGRRFEAPPLLARHLREQSGRAE